MKTITDSQTCSKYLFADDKAVTVKADCIEVGSPIEFIIGDLNSSNATVVEGVTEPEDWYGCKYNYVIDVWELCAGWVDPRLEVEAA
tara:strand:+ start:1370 stop:1630 length:261 start_codon:yes stop_codon:yes gene_type:complete